MAPGASGRCPGCGRALRAPEVVSDDDVWEMLQRAPEAAPAEPAAPQVDEEDEWNWRGTYDLAPAEPPRPMARPIDLDRATGSGPVGPWTDEPDVADEPALESSDQATDDEWNWRGTYELGETAPAAAPAPISEETHSPPPPRGWDAKRESEGAEPRDLDPWWPPRLLYPSRGAEGLAMVATMGVAGWVTGTLAPEYCLAILDDGEQMGVPSLGRLIALISALPVVMLSPLAVVYALQYLARVLVASSDGERPPPRPPDRNADGLLDGVGSWLLWIVLGAGVGLLPLITYLVAVGSSGESGPWNLGVAAALGLVGLPYALMALMMTFLHDDALAARPWAVLGAIARLGPSFLGLSLTVAALFAVVGIAFAVTLALRERVFVVYLLASLACWLLAAWLSIVAMHTLGAYHAPRKDRLKWRRERPRRSAT